jgi:hypothetical protein
MLPGTLELFDLSIGTVTKGVIYIRIPGKRKEWNPSSKYGKRLRSDSKKF